MEAETREAQPVCTVPAGTLAKAPSAECWDQPHWQGWIARGMQDNGGKEPNPDVA